MTSSGPSGDNQLVDAFSVLHHDAAMRTTIDLPDNLHRIASGLARHTGRTLSQAVVELMQRGLDLRPAGVGGSSYGVDRETGLPLARSARPITSDDVKSVEDDV